ncbi:MAG: DUF799 family lipoprotein [Deltaproteobacteria bacterium]|nr:DUF799 family lipoprotein [Deltaproteobacteria bacterium]
MKPRGVAICFAVLLLTGCAAKKDYSAYFAHEPRSILVVPALNETTTVEAQTQYMSTVSRPLAERGFYVFPVFLTELLLRDLGLPEAGLVQQLPPERFHELFGADAVLFVTIKEWGTKYVVLQSSTVVTVSFVLKDTRTGTVLWESTQSAVRSSGDGGGSLIGMLVAAAVTYAVNQMVDIDYRPLAQQANAQAFVMQGTGLPSGPYHPNFGKDKGAYSP